MVRRTGIFDRYINVAFAEKSATIKRTIYNDSSIICGDQASKRNHISATNGALY